MTRLLSLLMLSAVLLLPASLSAQDTATDPLAELLDPSATPDPSLEDLRLSLQELDQLLTELRQQLVTTGQVDPGVPFDATTLERLNAMETRIRVLTGEVERLQFDVQRMAEDGGRRIADIEFRLGELEGSGATAPAPASPLGGGVSNENAASRGGASGPVVAVTEQAAFDRAVALAEAGDLPAAQDTFSSFLESFPGGPLAPDARYGLGRVLASQGNYREAALNFLNAYSAAPNGENAPLALSSLADALGRIGQVTEACLTYEEALARFSSEGETYSTNILNAQQSLGCN
ncbi:tetratricopeptide repeat protein [Pontivivens insulae]|uniref:Cell division coordinator CpoB n=1 Tax=Pontivivens insulae TaxID=1639689 RepID=A0A2R8A8N3_9RHOB|nr:tetratricopeptide repeat protein [Pontivivens insulae]RED18688.1 TolA-binding protein [Pontivivens insulae]SPF28586.1 Cell division coordinator CpoB [Pontivivens insulae]